MHEDSSPSLREASGPAQSNAGFSSSDSSGFLASLAEEYSMSPAAVPALPMPTSETKDAGAFIASDWHALKGTDQKDLTFVKNPLDSAGDIVLQMEYPKGSYSGSDSGGVGGLQLAVYGEGQNRAILSYEVRTFQLSLSFSWRVAADPCLAGRLQ